jgi:hypothetical protein
LKLPRRVKVREIVAGRYPPGERPVSWDERRAGTDEVVTEDGERLLLFDSGGQSTPAPGWELLLRKPAPNHSGAVTWTLYGLGPK